MSDGISDIYSGASDFGKFSAIIGGIIGTLIGLIFIGMGSYIIYEASRRTQSVQGKITDSKCESTTSQNRQCMITVSYTTSQPSQMCTGSFSVQDENRFDKGNTITIFYDPSDPCNTGSLESREQDTIIGIILIVIGLFLIFIVWLVVYLTYKYKFFAAAEGVGTAIRILE